MKVSHESPLVLLNESRKYNDYDYALVHLFDEIPEYYQFFVDSLRMGREVILDNSIFELGVAYDSSEYVKWIEKLKPTYYIIPDVFNDGEETIKSLREFIVKYPNLPGKRMGVVQGKNYDEICKCYKEVDKYCDKISISFGYDIYLDLVKTGNKDERLMMGRRKLLSMLIDDEIINKNKPHHLLGMALPQELKEYGEYEWIESMDTSNPVVHGLFNVRYNEKGELNKKISTKLVDLIHNNIKESQMNDIIYNINMFKKNIGR